MAIVRDVEYPEKEIYIQFFVLFKNCIILVIENTQILFIFSR